MLAPDILWISPFISISQTFMKITLLNNPFPKKASHRVRQKQKKTKKNPTTPVNIMQMAANYFPAHRRVFRFTNGPKEMEGGSLLWAMNVFGDNSGGVLFLSVDDSTHSPWKVAISVLWRDAEQDINRSLWLDSIIVHKNTWILCSSLKKKNPSKRFKSLLRTLNALFTKVEK